jgi:neutral ceramidase
MHIARSLAWPLAVASMLVVSVSAAADNAAPSYLIGRGMIDITGPCVGLKMLGYVRPDQITEGIHLRQWSRAFIVAELNGAGRLAIVTTDLQSVTHSLALSVAEALKTRAGGVYGLDNVVIAATHTHAVPGGYWQYGADTPLGTPFYQEYYDALVEGIAASIVAAHNDLRPGRILVAAGEVEGAGAQRSRLAYLQNPDAERQKYRSDVDTEMTLLKFESAGQALGILNWYPVHPTSMSYRNRLISGDNKGYAAYAFERLQNVHPGARGGFVAAFAQSNGGDVTPNLRLDQRGPGAGEFESTRIIGERQTRAAARLFDSATEQLAGKIDYRHAYVDFTCLTVGDEFTHSGEKMTCPAAYGYSFAAGSTEDGGGQPLFKEGMTRQDPLIEAMAKVFSPLPSPTDELRRVHRPKPILLALGASDSPVLPQVLPISMARIGQLALVIGPAEFTTMSGRRFRESVKKAMPDVKFVVIAGYANDYAGYVATREEYEVQHYEGAATLFGPWTQAAYQQEFARLAADLFAGRPSTTLGLPADVRGTVRSTPLGTPYDRAGADATFGDVAQDVVSTCRRGEQVSASFWTGNPQNGYRPNRRFAFVERMEQGNWRALVGDGDWEVKCRWAQPSPQPPAGPDGTTPGAAKNPPTRSASTKSDSLAAHLLTVEWDVPTDAAPGSYRIVHRGVFKAEADRQLHEFEAHSTTFVVQ